VRRRYNPIVPLHSDNDEERFVRIQQLMEEYRVKHEDLVAYVRRVKEISQQRQREAELTLRDANDAMQPIKKGRRRKVR
jgi:hypothetical protein